MQQLHKPTRRPHTSLGFGPSEHADRWHRNATTASELGRAESAADDIAVLVSSFLSREGVEDVSAPQQGGRREQREDRDQWEVREEEQDGAFVGGISRCGSSAAAGAGGAAGGGVRGETRMREEWQGFGGVARAVKNANSAVALMKKVRAKRGVNLEGMPCNV